MIKLIGQLYALERALAQSREDYPDHKSYRQSRYEKRQERGQEIMNKLRVKLDDLKPKVAPKTALGKALHYLDNQWPRLIRYLEDGSYPIDNNPVENAIRPFAIGRKNWLFSSSVSGAKASANLYSLIETAKANGLEPYAYLKHLFNELPKINNYDDVDKLLPSNYKNAVN